MDRNRATQEIFLGETSPTSCVLCPEWKRPPAVCQGSLPQWDRSLSFEPREMFCEVDPGKPVLVLGSQDS